MIFIELGECDEIERVFSDEDESIVIISWSNCVTNHNPASVYTIKNISPLRELGEAFVAPWARDRPAP